jgi:hypothetical protein
MLKLAVKYIFCIVTELSFRTVNDMIGDSKPPLL